MTIRAAGGVMWLEDDAGLRVALIHRPRHDDWSLPKGKLEAGEDELAAALRETYEETGWRVEAVEDLGTARYRVAGKPKIVRYWSLRADHGEFRPNREVDRLEWLPIERARTRLSYPREVEILDRFAASRGI